MANPGYGAVMTDPALDITKTQDSAIATLQKSLAADEATIASHTSTLSGHTSSINSLNSTTSELGYYESKYFTTPLLSPIATSTATIMVSDRTYFQYIGRTRRSTGSCRVVFKLKTALVLTEPADPTEWGQLSVWKGVPLETTVPASLSMLWFVDAVVTEALFNASPGIQTTLASWTSSDCPAGTDLWIGFGSKAATPAQFDSLCINYLGYGITLIATGKSSELGTNHLITTGLTINSTVGAPAIIASLT